jgi:hypothetical protein
MDDSFFPKLLGSAECIAMFPEALDEAYVLPSGLRETDQAKRGVKSKSTFFTQQHAEAWRRGEVEFGGKKGVWLTGFEILVYF